MPSDNALIASLVRGELAKARISGRKVAELMDWPADGVGRRLRGEVPFRADELLALSRLLNVPVERFYTDAVSATPPYGLPAVQPQATS